MKKVMFFLVAVMAVSFFSCVNQPATVTTTETKVVTTTIEDLDTQGFLVSKEMVAKGNTVWGFSQKVYGTGFRWREIVAQNDFLQKPGRVYYNDSLKMWIVKIYPGEYLNIGGTVITPRYSYVSEETTTSKTAITEPVQQIITASPIPWWGWLLILALIALFISLFWFYPRNNRQTNVTNVAIDRTGIDRSTNVAISESYGFRREVAEHMLTNPNLTRATMTENSNQDRDFTVVAEYTVR